MIAVVPEIPKGNRQAHPQLRDARIGAGQAPGKRCTGVIVLRRESVEPDTRVRAEEQRVGFLSQRDVEGE